MNLHIDSMNSGRYSSIAPAKSGAGIGVPEFTIAHNRASGFFVCDAQLYLSMVGWVGASKDAPGSVVTGTPTLLSSPPMIGVCGGEFLILTTEAAIMATIPTTRTPEVLLAEGRAVTTSLAVAAYFIKRHDDVLKRIKNLECSPEFTARNFAVSEYTDPTGRKLPCYEITRDGFTFLAMSFTGKRAAKFKEDYIEAFNRMESRLTGESPALPECIRLTVTIKDGVVINSRPMREGEIVGSLEDFIELAERQGFLVINLDDLKSLSISKKLRGCK
ncbi:Rha family phage regulatory protein [Hafnia paralvei]|uniref:Rha family phage regulatory protein n=1 Tax=Hafnia paralvei TaxID=546367 RepID=UPI00241D4657|nr:Rha family phage regulatory protein [Hafnia paralvei]